MSFFNQIKGALSTLIGKDLTESSEAEIAQALEDAAGKEVVATVEENSSVEMSTEMRNVLDAQNSLIIAQANQIVGLSNQITALTTLVDAATTKFTEGLEGVKTSTTLAISGIKDTVAKASVLKGEVSDTARPVKDAVVAAVDAAEKDEEETVVELNTTDFLKFRQSLNR